MVIFPQGSGWKFYLKKNSIWNHHLATILDSSNWVTIVDGSEILRSPVEVGSWNPTIYKVLAPSQRGDRRISSISPPTPPARYGWSHVDRPLHE